MPGRSLLTVLALAMTMALLVVMLRDSHGAAQDSSPNAGVSAPWVARLESLRPDQPLNYFELAEEMADASTEGSGDRAMARHLFALAAALDPKRLGRSACLALADIESDEAARRRLGALAVMLSSGLAAGPAGQSASAAEPPLSTVLAACEAISRYRKGQGAQAITALKKPGVSALLGPWSSALPGGLTRFEEECRQLRGVRPSLSDEQVNRLLRLELALMTGVQRTWTTEVLVMPRGLPLIEVDPAHLDESLGVDATRAVYRDGRWVDR